MMRDDVRSRSSISCTDKLVCIISIENNNIIHMSNWKLELDIRYGVCTCRSMTLQIINIHRTRTCTIPIAHV